MSGAGASAGDDLPSGREGPHAFVADLERPELEPDDRHHLDRVLRLRPGDPFTVSDGAGRWRRCRFGPDVEVDGDPVAVAASEPALTIAVALVKGQRPELVAQKLTELGIDRIVFFVAARSVVRWDDARSDRQLQRLRKVSREAAMQSRRVRLPSIELASDFATVAAIPGAVIADREGAAPSAGLHTVLVGPEGGWTETERGAGLAAVRLAEGVLRAETAAIATGVVLAGLRSSLLGAG